WSAGFTWRSGVRPLRTSERRRSPSSAPAATASRTSARRSSTSTCSSTGHDVPTLLAKRADHEALRRYREPGLHGPSRATGSLRGALASGSEGAALPSEGQECDLDLLLRRRQPGRHIRPEARASAPPR